MQTIKTLGDLKKALSVYDDELPLDLNLFDGDSYRPLTFGVDSFIFTKVDPSLNQRSLNITTIRRGS